MSSKASNFNFQLFQGDDFQMLLTVRDDNNTPIDITGYVFNSQARLTFEGAVEFEFEFEKRDQGGFPGQVFMKLGNVASSAINTRELKSYRYDVEMTDGDDKISKLIYGTITVIPEVTRDEAP